MERAKSTSLTSLSSQKGGIQKGRVVVDVGGRDRDGPGSDTEPNEDEEVGADDDDDDNDDEDESESESDDDPCAVCGSHGTLILCDGEDGTCPLAVHLDCYKPGTTLPEGDWFCDRCAAKKTLQEAKVICCNDDSPTLRKTSPIPGADIAFIHVNCAIWNKEVEMSRRDEPVKFAPYLLKVNHPCHICSAKTGLRVRCSKEGCGCWFHVSCAIKEGILKPNRKRSVRTNLKLLLCTDHYNAVHNISKNGGPNSASARDRPGSGNGSSLKRAVGGPGGIGGKGDLKDWEAAKERRLHNQTSGNPGAKRRVVDSDVSDSERPSISKKPKTSQAKVSAEVSDYDHDIDKEASMEEEDEEIEEGGAPKVEVERRQSGGNGSSGFGGGGLASTSHSISNSKLANELFGKDSLPTSTNVPKINASNLGGNRRVSEASPLGVNGRDKVRPGGLARPRDPSGSSAPIDNPAELLQRVIRAQDKQTADLKSLISNLQKPTPVQKLPAAPASAASALDSLLDKAHEATEMTALRKELEKANSKIALMETNAMTLRANLVIIFNQLKLSAVTPDETSVDDYVAVIRDLMTKN